MIRYRQIKVAGRPYGHKAVLFVQNVLFHRRHSVHTPLLLLHCFEAIDTDLVYAWTLDGLSLEYR